MKRLISLLMMVVLLYALPATAQQPQEKTNTFWLPQYDRDITLDSPNSASVNFEYYNNELIVVLKPNVPVGEQGPFFPITIINEVAALKRATDAGVLQELHTEYQKNVEPLSIPQDLKNRAAELGLERIIHIKLPPSELDYWFSEFSKDPAVERVYRSSVVKTLHHTNDPLAQQQYQLGQIRAHEAQQKNPCTTPSSVTAVIDTGIDNTHPDLNPAIKNFDATGTKPDASDGFGHGTAVSSVIAARTNNGIGIAGISPCTLILNVKVLSDGGSGSWDDVVKGTMWAIPECITLGLPCVFNYSIGGAGPVPSVDAVFELANEKNIIIVAAAGNNGVSLDRFSLYPASAAEKLPNVVIAVSVGPSGNPSSFTNYTTKMLSGVCAGEKILMAVPTKGRMTHPSGYLAESGTSFSAPCLSGVIAAARGKFDLNVKKIRSVILGSVTEVPVLKNYATSGGIVNMVDFLNIPLMPPPALSDFKISEINWSSLRVQFRSVNDINGGKLVRFIIYLSKKPFDENSIDRADVRGLEFSLKRGGDELVELTIPKLDPATTFFFSVQGGDRGGNLTPLTEVLTTTTLQPASFLTWTFTNNDNSCDPGQFHVNHGPLGIIIETFGGENKLLWHQSDGARKVFKNNCNWWAKNEEERHYKTKFISDSVLYSEVINLSQAPRGAGLEFEYHQELFPTARGGDDVVQVWAALRNASNVPVRSILIAEYDPLDNSKNPLLSRRIRLDLSEAEDAWRELQQKQTRPFPFKMVIIFRFLSFTIGAGGGFGPIVGDVKILTNP